MGLTHIMNDEIHDAKDKELIAVLEDRGYAVLVKEDDLDIFEQNLLIELLAPIEKNIYARRIRNKLLYKRYGVT